MPRSFHPPGKWFDLFGWLAQLDDVLLQHEKTKADAERVLDVTLPPLVR
jgi:hypothetical protein